MKPALRAAARILAAAMTAATEPAAAEAAPEDPCLWLEEVQGEKALDWVRARNAESRAA